MEDTLSELIRALSLVMNPLQAEGFLHLAAFTRDKTPETLTYEDWPAIESAVRQALIGTSAAGSADLICGRLREVFLRSCSSSDC